jgi:hypothetical protein
MLRGPSLKDLHFRYQGLHLWEFAHSLEIPQLYVIGNRPSVGSYPF